MQCSKSAVCTAVAIVVRLVLLMCSGAGWIVFAVGFSQVYRWAQDQPSIYITMFHWMFGVSAFLLYPTLLLHTFLSKWKDNAGNITLAIVNFFRMFYMLGAGGLLAITVLLIALGSLDSVLLYAKLMLGGCGVSVLFYWISEILWPLFQLRRQPQPNIDSEGEELQESFILPNTSPFTHCTPPHPLPYTQLK